MRTLMFSVLLLMLGVGLASAQQPPPPGQDSGDSAHYGWADVLRVDPIYDQVQVSHPEQNCYQSQVIHREGGNSTAGTILGAVIGGVLGHTVGKGNGRTAATVAGAVAGGAVGNHVSNGNEREYSTPETRCDQIQSVRNERRVVGYNVEYRYRGQVFSARLDYDPGERLRVRVMVTPAG